MPNSKDIVRSNSADHVVRDVMAGLYDGRYVAGQRLVEPDLMRQYQLSRSTIREALTRLAAEGVVSIVPFKGAQIRQLSRRDARNVLAILEVTIGLAARQAAENIKSPGAAGQFQSCYDDLAALARERDTFEFVRSRNRFYRIMTKIGRNPDLDRLLSGLQVHLIRSTIRQSNENRLVDYARIANAILDADPAAAEMAARDHIRHIVATLAEVPENAFAPDLDDGTAWAEG